MHDRAQTWTSSGAAVLLPYLDPLSYAQSQLVDADCNDIVCNHCNRMLLLRLRCLLF
jgi:hypothetical protein